ncbi:MAG: dihydroorotate dehydrogenase electron transfer subunit [Clostridiales bacterium]|nr:dihydroorotate dehydrogenase electron transfer subunit [Clostridiales bacterium]
MKKEIKNGENNRKTDKTMLHAVVHSQEQIANQIFSMWLQADPIAGNARPGQFVSVYSNDSGRLLPRPVSICEADSAHGRIRLVYRVAGKGTAEFARCRAGDSLDLLGPLGNGYPLDRCPEGRTALLIGGGIGIPPMVELAKQLKGRVLSVVGYRDELFLTDELKTCGELYAAVEDHSLYRRLHGMENDYGTFYGTVTQGNVIDCIRENDLHADVIYACGPTPMLRAVKAYAQKKETECWLSLEQRMACGIGACLACVCESAKIDAHSQVKNKRVCKEGPVFAAEDVVL